MFKLGFSNSFRRFWTFLRVYEPGPSKREVLGPKKWSSRALEMTLHMHGRGMRKHASPKTLILTTLMARLQTAITHLIKIQTRKILYSNWSPRCLLFNEINHTQNFFVDQKLWSKKWAKVICQHRFQNDLSIFELWLLPIYQNNFNYFL